MKHKLFTYFILTALLISCKIFSTNKTQTKAVEPKSKTINKIPQFISPNGDGKNDCWEILVLKKYPKNVVEIFNRWGNLVYEKEGYSDEFCGAPNIENGKTKTEKDSMLPEGTYYYIIDLGDKSIEPYTGYLQIKK